MDIDNLQQNMNTRVVFREPRGFIRWLQLFFAIVAFSTVVDFATNLTIDITCAGQASTTTIAPPPANGTTTTPPPAPPSTPAPIVHAILEVKYPFYFADQKVNNSCPGSELSYTHVSSLDVSPKFFVMTGVLSLIYVSSSLVIYLLFSSTYDSIPVMPVADLIITAILCLFWFVASSSFSSSVTLLKSTVTYNAMFQALCQGPYTCVEAAAPSWKSLNVGLVSGFTSFFLWGCNIWFVYKETHFHTPRDHFAPR